MLDKVFAWMSLEMLHNPWGAAWQKLLAIIGINNARKYFFKRIKF